jgi:hypothetical protein
MLAPYEQIQIEQLPEKLREAVSAVEQDFSRWGGEIISMTKLEFDRPEAPGLTKTLYKVIMLVTNTFIVLEQTTGDDIDLGVCKAMLTIGTVKEILASAPEHTGLSCFREAV